MTITQEKLSLFLSAHGPATVVDNRGIVKRIKGENRDSCELVESAEKIFYGGRWYSRLEFKQVVEETLEDYSSY